METVTITGHADALAALTDARLTVPPLAPDATTGRMGWLRSHVGRFSEGEAHQRRRAYAVTALADVDPEALRRRAAELASEDDPARRAPVAALAEALGVPPAEAIAVADAVVTVARGYFPGTDAGDAGEDAVAYLIKIFGGVADEPTAARIGLLVQACEATAALVRNEDPPVRALRRVSTAPARIGQVDVPAGAMVVVDVAAANRDCADGQLTFGAGPHACPGRDHALALVAGVIEAVGR
jgi:cytochrome P450